MIELCCTCKSFFFPDYIGECDVQRAYVCVCNTTADMIGKFPGDVLFSAFCSHCTAGKRTVKL